MERWICGDHSFMFEALFRMGGWIISFNKLRFDLRRLSKFSRLRSLINGYHSSSNLSLGISRQYGHFFIADRLGPEDTKIHTISTSVIRTLLLVAKILKFIKSLPLQHRHLYNADTWVCPFRVRYEAVRVYS